MTSERYKLIIRPTSILETAFHTVMTAINIFHGALALPMGPLLVPTYLQDQPKIIAIAYSVVILLIKKLIGDQSAYL